MLSFKIMKLFVTSHQTMNSLITFMGQTNKTPSSLGTNHTTKEKREILISSNNAIFHRELTKSAI
jgi:hypothetical protein